MLLYVRLLALSSEAQCTELTCKRLQLSQSTTNVGEGLARRRALAYARASDTSSGHNDPRTFPITQRQAATTALITIQNFQ